MEKYNSYEPFSVCFNMMKIKYRDYDEDLTRLDFLSPFDKVNVFINMESVFKHLSSIPDIEKKMILQRDYPVLFISNFVNLAGHYKRFFMGNGLDTRVYLYNTDFVSTEFAQCKYNEDYRSYYMVKYTDNPKFIYLTEGLKNKVIPEVKTIIDYVPNVYYITSKNIEGSLIPMIVGNQDKSRKNLIITRDLYESQYSLIDNYVSSFVVKGSQESYPILSKIPQYLAKMSNRKIEDMTDEFINVLSAYPIYIGLLAVLGNKDRSIDGISGVGVMKYFQMVTQAVESFRINPDNIMPEMLSSMFKTSLTNFDDDMANEFINNYYCFSVKKMYDELTSADIDSVLNQVTDHVDITGLVELNRTKFYNHPLILEALSM